VKQTTKKPTTKEKRLKEIMAAFAYADSLPIPQNAKKIDVVAVTRPQLQ
jgi:hypothetical protein